MENKEPKPIHQQIIDIVGGEDKFREIARLKRKNNKTMENEFVSYEVALALKELGFDEECFAKYVPYFSESGWKLELDIQFTNITNSLIGKGFSAPLKQQVFKWFRDKYGLIGEIFSQLRPSNKFMYAFKIGGSDIIYDGYLTYEEAEDGVINKLIEIAKRQDNLNKCLACNEDKGNNELYCSFCRNQN